AFAEPCDLVERRTLPGEARYATRDRDHKARRACAAAGGLAALGDELRLHPLDPPSQGGIAEQRHPPGAHPRSAGGCSLHCFGHMWLAAKAAGDLTPVLMPR